MAASTYGVNNCRGGALRGLAAGIGIAAAVLSAGAGTPAYGYLYMSATDDHGFITFDSDNPQKLTLLDKTFGRIHPSAGECVDGKIYAYRTRLGTDYAIRSDSWAVYDATTYQLIEKRSVYGMGRVADMAYDYTTNTLYALVESADNSGELASTRLCAVDMATGDCTVVGSPAGMLSTGGEDDVLVALACDAAGQLYAMSAQRYLYRLDKHSAEASRVGERHALPTARQMQSMAFAADGTLWWAQQHTAHAYFCAVDLATAIPGGFVDTSSDYSKLARLGDDDQVTALFFKDRTVRPRSLLAVDGLRATVEADADGKRWVSLAWSPPDRDYAGEPARPAGIEVYRLGQSEPIASLGGDATSCTDFPALLGAADPPVDISYEVIAYSDAGYGFPSFVAIASDTEGIADLRAAGSDITLSVADGVLLLAAGSAIAYASVADLGGRTLRRAAGQGGTSMAIDVAALDSGPYIVVVATDSGCRASFKVML